jgi:F0F1-type ATP synthase assembly protein I
MLWRVWPPLPEEKMRPPRRPEQASMDDGQHQKFRYMRLVGTLTMVPFLLVAGPLAGFFIGKLLDSWLNTEFLKWVFLALGFAAGIREVVRLIRRTSRDLDRL